MNDPAQQRIRIGDCTLDLHSAQLMRDGSPVHVRAKTFALLHHLVRNPCRVIGKDELFDVIWPDVTVTDDSLTQAVRELRLALGAAGAAALRTVPRRGYVLDLPPASPVAAGTAARPPVVVILPFAVTSPDPSDAALADGMVEETTHATARYGQVRVIARHSAFQFRPDTTAAAKAATTLGAAYFVEGTARRIGGALHMSPALCETATGRQIWGETFRLSPDEFREVPSIIAHRIVSRVSLEVERGIRMVITGGGSDNLDAYQHFVAALSLMRQYGDGVNQRARRHLDEALQLDPAFALAHSYRGMAETLVHNYGASPRAVLETALEHAQRGLQIAPEEARCHWIVGQIRLYLRQHATAELHLRRALDLNPFDPDIIAQMGYLATMRGRPDEGVDWVQRAVALNPLHPPWYHSVLGIAYMQAGHYRDAIAFLQLLPRNTAWRHARIASCHAALGEVATAARHMAEAEAINPGWDAVAEFRQGLELEHAHDLERVLQDIGRAVDVWRATR